MVSPFGRAPRGLGAGAPALIVVVGLKAEARLVETPGVRLVISGARPLALAEKLAPALARGAAGVLSFGLCGALDPGLAPGALVVGRAVIAGGRRWEVDPAWFERLAAALPGAGRGDVAGEDEMVALAADKRALNVQTGAVAADMESHVVARLASERGVPFAVLRAVSDRADQSLPAAARAGLRHDGGAAVAAVLGALVRRPGELGDLLALAVGAGAALRALGDARHLLGPWLGCPDFLQHPLDMA